MLALIDGDIVLYRCCWASQNDPLDICKFRTDEMIDNILVETKANEFQLWLSDSKEQNFRYKLDPSYKANRKEEKPNHFNEIKEYLLVKWGARFAYGMEADDALGIEQSRDLDVKDVTVICTIDKDLKQIPGNHYNFVKKEFDFVTPEQGLRTFYTQLATGDSVDGIQGIPGIGPKKAIRLLEGLSLEQDLFLAVLGGYKQAGLGEEVVLRNGRLLKILQEENEKLWSFPESYQTEETGALSTQSMERDHNQYTEPTGLGMNLVG